MIFSAHLRPRPSAVGPLSPSVAHKTLWLLSTPPPCALHSCDCGCQTPLALDLRKDPSTAVPPTSSFSAGGQQPRRRQDFLPLVLPIRLSVEFSPGEAVRIREQTSDPRIQTHVVDKQHTRAAAGDSRLRQARC